MGYPPQGSGATTADLERDIAAHAALTTGIHGVGSLHIAGFHSAGQAVDKTIWKATNQRAVNDDDRTVDLAWTELDLTAYTSENAKFAVLMLQLKPNTIGTGSSCNVRVRKHGDTPTYVALLRIPKDGVTVPVATEEVVEVGLGPGQTIDYTIDVGTGWDIDTEIDVLGYRE